MRAPSPTVWVRVHGALTVVWALLMIPSLLFWQESVPWLVIMSCWANVAGSAASWQSARADRNSPTCEQLDRLERKVSALQRMLASRR
jgi:RsiW-degrading membrane proteinase PrsW (M82 family)